MDIVGLSRFPELAVVSTVNHTTVHGDRIREDPVDEVLPVGVPHGGDATFREGEVDGLGEVQWDGVGITQV